MMTTTTTTTTAAAVAEFSSIDSGSSLPYEMQRWISVTFEGVQSTRERSTNGAATVANEAGF
jgi:hypothetical protein